MITKMTKYSFVLLSNEVDGFLSSLQELGIVDVTRSSKPVDDHSSSLVEEAAVLKKLMEDIESEKFTRDALYVNLSTELSEARKSVPEVMPWGDYDMKAVHDLGKLGLKMRFYCVPAKRFNPEWKNEVALEIIDDSGSMVYFVTVGPVEGYSFEVNEAKAPAMTATELTELISSLEQKIAVREEELRSEKKDLPELKEKYSEIINELEKYLASAAKETAAEDMVSVIEGFAPTENDAQLAEKLDALGVMYLSEDAREEDNPPIKLRNNRFSKLFESITGMYGMPIYNEFDPTPVLAIFFMLFFAMCMGDAGYGIVLFLFGIATNKKWVNIEMFRGIGTLISILGAATFFVGLILGTAFGINLYEAAWVPDAMKSIMIPDSVKIMGYSAQMVLAVGIGLLHICLAMIIKTALYTHRDGFRASLSAWGWTLLIVGGVLAFGLGMLLNIDQDTMKWVIIGIGAVSALGIFVFNKPGRNPLMNIGAGLWDTYQMASGLIGDLLSYTRLYALGLAGGLLGGAFNLLGTMLLGDHPTWQWLFCILILVLGHTLNILMSSLGAFVHPLRLTFVEYFKNSGYTGEGRLYKPLKKNK